MAVPSDEEVDVEVVAVDGMDPMEVVGRLPDDWNPVISDLDDEEVADDED